MQRELTGWHVLALFILGFGTIIAVNLVLATQAVRSFPGLETANSYVASQRFDAERDAQRALNWTVGAELAPDALLLHLTDAQGAPLRPETLALELGRPTSAAQDITLEPVWTGTSYAMPPPPAPGRWNLYLSASAADGTAFRKVLPLYVKAVE